MLGCGVQHGAIGCGRVMGENVRENCKIQTTGCGAIRSRKFIHRKGNLKFVQLH